MKNILKIIFSLYNKTDGLLVHKVVQIFGVKIKILNLKKTILLNSNNFATKIDILKQNFFQLLVEVNNNSSELFCLKKDSTLNIMSKEFFSCDKELIMGVLGHWSQIDTILFPINKKSIIYKNYIDRLGKGELAWFYRKSTDFIQETIFIKNQNGVLQIRKNAIGDSKCYDFEKEYLKDYIKGITMDDYMKSLPIELQKELAEEYLNFVFENYENPKTKKFPGWFWEMVPANIVINKNGFNFIDTFMQLKNKQELEKDCIVYRLLMPHNKNLYDYFIKKYNLQDNSKLYEQWKDYLKYKDEIFWGSEGEIQKYFNELIDINNFIEQYALN